MVDTARLKGLIHDKGITMDKAAISIGINPATFYRKLNKNGVSFTVAEVGKLARLLDLDGATMERIFFQR